MSKEVKIGILGATGVVGQEMMDYYVDEQAVMVEASNLPDFTEAVYAFCEKRKPEFNKKA